MKVFLTQHEKIDILKSLEYAAKRRGAVGKEVVTPRLLKSTLDTLSVSGPQPGVVVFNAEQVGLVRLLVGVADS